MAIQLPALATGQGQARIGATLRTIAQMRQADERSALLQAQGQRTERLLGLKEREFEAGQAKEQRITGARGELAMAGKEEMPALLRKYLAIDPKGGGEFIAGLDKMDARQSKQFEQRNDQIGALLSQVQSLPMPQRPMAYIQARAQAEDMGIDLKNAPAQYDPTWVDQNLALSLGGKDYMDMKAAAAAKVPTPLEAARTKKVEIEAQEIERKAISRESFIKSLTEGDDLGGGAGVDVLAGDLVGGSGEETVTGGAMPSNRQIFQSLLPQAQAGILASSDPQKAFSDAVEKKNTADIKADAEDIKTALTQQKRFTAESKTFKDVSDAYGRIVKSARKPDPAGDLSMVFNYMKMLDPGSVVRESEFRTAASVGSYGEQVQQWLQKASSGEGLTPNQRKWFKDRAGILYYEQRRKHTKLRGEYKRIAKEYGVKPERVIVDYYGDYISKTDFDQTVEATGLSVDEVFKRMGKKFDVSPQYMRAIYEGTD